MSHTCDRCKRPIKGTHDDPPTFVLEPDPETTYRTCLYCERTLALRHDYTMIDGVEYNKTSWRYLDTLSHEELLRTAKRLGYQPEKEDTFPRARRNRKDLC